jgi:type II secretory pathway predicted ATPase ExeA
VASSVTTPGDRAKVKVPEGTEGRERDLQVLAAKRRRPVVLVIDEAHDLHHKTLTGLKRLMKIVADSGVLMSVLMVGHPRLRNDLRRPQMEEIGYRTTIFDYEGIGADQGSGERMVKIVR